MSSLRGCVYIYIYRNDPLKGMYRALSPSVPAQNQGVSLEALYLRLRRLLRPHAGPQWAHVPENTGLASRDAGRREKGAASRRCLGFLRAFIPFF